MDTVVGIDCDLHELTWWMQCAEGETVSFQGDTDLGIAKLTRTLERACPESKPGATVLFEIASPVDYTSKDQNAASIAYHKRRWTIYNVAIAQRMDMLFGVGLLFRHRFLVAPSSAWTQGFNEKRRHSIYKCDGDTHDLREAQCMAKSYPRLAKVWQPLTTYLKHL